MKKILLATLLTVAAVGCGDDPSAVKAAGSAQFTVHQSGEADGHTGLSFPEGTIIDAPPGIGVGFFGTCARTANGWAVSISRSDAANEGGLRKIDISSALGTGAMALSLSLGQTVFDGAAACTGTSTAVGSNGLNLTAHCVGLAAASDLRTLDGDVTLQLSNCTTR